MSNIDFARTCESYEGTSWVHQGRLPHVGLDCAGIIIAALREVGEEPDDDIAYTRQQDHQKLESWLRKHCELVFGELEIGDILIFGQRNRALHIGVYTERGLTHAFLRDGEKNGAVVVQDFGEFWRKSLIAIWRYKFRNK